MHARSTTRTALAALAVTAALGLVGGACSSGSDDSSTGDGAGTGSTTTVGSTSTTPPEDSAGGDLVGTWTIDAGDALAANTANLGGTAGLTCSGPIVMTFGADGTFDRRGDITCSAGPISGSGTLSSTGSWSTSGDTLTVADTVTSGTMQLGGVSMPMPDSFGDGEGTYSVEGGTLTLVFTDPSVGTVTQVYTRS